MTKKRSEELAIFHNSRKYAMKRVSMETRKIFGNHGYSKLSRAAWAIAAGNPRFAKYLHGAKMGTPESYAVLDQLVRDAYEVAKLIGCIRRWYYDDGDFERIWSAILGDNHGNQVNDSDKMFNQKATKERENRAKQGKAKLKPMFRLFICFLLGLLTRFVLGLLFPGL